MTRIFIQIPSLADPLLADTVIDALDKAKLPERIFFGIYDQRDEPEPLIKRLQQDYPEQIRVKTVPISQAKGVCLARAEANSLWKEEEWLLQIDGHMLFQPHWDQICFQQWQSCRDNNALLTSYVPGFEPGQKAAKYPIAREIGISGFNHDQVLCFKSGPSIAGCTEPKETFGMIGNFLFGPAEIIQNVPHDPQIYFTGEEISYAIRLWTSGYNLYCPVRIPVQHFWASGERTKVRPRQWHLDKNWWRLNQVSTERVKAVCGYADRPVELGPYGRGTTRLLEDYQNRYGIYFAERRIELRIALD